MNKKLLNLLTLPLLAFTLFLSACADTEDESTGVLVMGTSSGFPPFEYFGGDDGKTIVGFDVDIAERIAKNAGMTLHIEDIPFDSLLVALESGKIDMAIAGMSITEARAKSVDFSQPYHSNPQVAVIQKSDINTLNSVEALQGKKVAAQFGTTSAILAETMTDNIVAFKEPFEGIAELNNNKVDFVVIDQAAAKSFLKQNTHLVIVDFPLEDPNNILSGGEGIAVQKGNAALLKIINDTIDEMQTDGSFDVLTKKYFE